MQVKVWVTELEESQVVVVEIKDESMTSDAVINLVLLLYNFCRSKF